MKHCDATKEYERDGGDISAAELTRAAEQNEAALRAHLDIGGLFLQDQVGNLLRNLRRE